GGAAPGLRAGQNTLGDNDRLGLPPQPVKLCVLIPAASAPTSWRYADTFSSSVLPSLAFHAAGARRASARASHDRGAGLGAPRGISDSQPGGDHAGAGCG